MRVSAADDVESLAGVTASWFWLVRKTGWADGPACVECCVCLFANDLAIALALALALAIALVLAFALARARALANMFGVVFLAAPTQVDPTGVSLGPHRLDPNLLWGRPSTPRAPANLCKPWGQWSRRTFTLRPSRCRTRRQRPRRTRRRTCSRPQTASSGFPASG